jgi:ribulose-5-phosphate 4-epimerase/fuculose-1-phosphate aldolase
MRQEGELEMANTSKAAVRGATPLSAGEFTSIEAERAQRKGRLAVAYRLFARLGYDHWVAGHITVRDPEFPDRFWVNPFGRSWRLLCASDLLLVDLDGTIVQGHGELNAAAFAIHSEIHRARPDVVAAAHAHTIHGRAWSATGRLLEPLSQDACAFYEDHAVFDDYTGVVYDADEGGHLARALGTRKALLLEHHGLLTVGETVDEAAFWLHLLERCCEAQLLVSSLQPRGDGTPAYRALEPAIAAKTFEQVGAHVHGWLGFQPFYEEIVQAEPEVLD